MRTTMKVLYFLPLLMLLGVGVSKAAAPDNETAITDGSLQQVVLGTFKKSSSTVNAAANDVNETRRINVTNNGILRTVEGTSYSSWTSVITGPSVGSGGVSMTTQAVNVGNTSSNTWVFDVAWASAPVLYKGFKPTSGVGQLSIWDCRGDTNAATALLLWKGVVTSTDSKGVGSFDQWMSSGLMPVQDGTLIGTHQWERTDRIKRR